MVMVVVSDLIVCPVASVLILLFSFPLAVHDYSACTLASCELSEFEKVEIKKAKCAFRL